MRGFEKISFDQFSKDISDNKELYDTYSLPARKTKGAAGYDFYSLIDYDLQPGEKKIIPTGVKMWCQEDEFLMLVVRSSVGIKYDVILRNQVGIIDSDYYNCPENEGHMWVALRNNGDDVYHIRKGEAFCQGIFLKYLTCEDNVDTKREGWSAADSIQKNKNKKEG